MRFTSLAILLPYVAATVIAAQPPHQFRESMYRAGSFHVQSSSATASIRKFTPARPIPPKVWIAACKQKADSLGYVVASIKAIPERNQYECNLTKGPNKGPFLDVSREVSLMANE